MTETTHRRTGLCDFQPCEDDVKALIAKAEGHELGTDFLATGALDSVAATFGVHAFVVDAARQTLNGSKQSMPVVETLQTTGIESFRA